MTQPPVHSDARTLRRVVIASCSGTAIEWYDFFIFGTLASTLSQHFYAPGHPLNALLQTLATFAVGFAVRPFGALVFGHFGDRFGRKAAFLTTLLIMGGATAAIGILPGYETIGSAAPIILVALRMLQGLALGGEYGGAAVYVAEHASREKRGYYTSFIYTTGTIGLLVSLLVVSGVRAWLGEDAFKAWGWRIPFLASLILVGLSYYIRAKLHESPVFAEMKSGNRQSDSPIRESFAGEGGWRVIAAILFGLLAGHAVVWYTGQFYALFFLQTILKVPAASAYTVVIAALVLGAPFFVFFGWLSDKVGRKPILMTGLLLASISYYPLYRWTSASVDPFQPVTITFIILLQVIFAAMVTGPLGAFLVDSFPPRVRYTSVSFVHHSGTGWFGGSLPLIATAVVAKTGNIYAGLIYPIVVAFAAFVIGMIFVRERKAE
jgi:MFS family permease